MLGVAVGIFGFLVFGLGGVVAAREIEPYPRVGLGERQRGKEAQREQSCLEAIHFRRLRRWRGRRADARGNSECQRPGHPSRQSPAPQPLRTRGPPSSIPAPFLNNSAPAPSLGVRWQPGRCATVPGLPLSRLLKRCMSIMSPRLAVLLLQRPPCWPAGARSPRSWASRRAVKNPSRGRAGAGHPLQARAREREAPGQDFISFGSTDCEDLICVRDAQLARDPDPNAVATGLLQPGVCRGLFLPVW